MNWEYAIDPTRQFIHLRVWGTATAAEFRRAQVEVGADPAFNPSFSLLLDLTDADMHSMSTADIQALASRTTLDARPLAGRP